MQKIIKSKIQMTNKGQIIYSLLPRAEGLLLGTICGMEVENFNREGAVKTLTNTIALLHKVRLLLEQELNSEPQLPQADVIGSASVLTLTDEVKSEVKRLWALPSDYTNPPKVAALKLVIKFAKDNGVEIGIKKAKEVIDQHCL